MSEYKQEFFERYIVGLTAIVVGFAIAIISILGPLGLDIIQYASSESAITQGMGQDLVNLVLITPLCLIGGFLYIAKKENAKSLELVSELRSNGYNTIVSIGEWEENDIGTNCGQFATELLNGEVSIKKNYTTSSYPF